MADALHNAAIGFDIESPTSSYRQAALVTPNVFSCRHMRCHHIPGLEAEHPAGTFGAGAWEAVLVHPAHLSAAVPHGLDSQGSQRRRNVETVHFSYAGRIDPVGLGQVETGAVEFGPASRPAVNG